MKHPGHVYSRCLLTLHKVADSTNTLLRPPVDVPEGAWRFGAKVKLVSKES